MFCLLLGLSLSFLTAQTVNLRLQCWRFTAAFMPPSGNGWPSSPSWIITLSSSIGKWLPLPNRKICSITFGTPVTGCSGYFGRSLRPPSISKYGSHYGQTPK